MDIILSLFIHLYIYLLINCSMIFLALSHTHLPFTPTLCQEAKGPRRTERWDHSSSLSAPKSHGFGCKIHENMDFP